ncbi:hypothetical protein HR45_00655 [Shewanella mangrovi]|uniref:Uncharacterized protein n=1 Tax=Shewanella mangrovi TaxID=1515746 RepID=A0A094JID5_9GAMM|nr:hypothetical protein [Shewanella mangrovi]KFZ38947.1 hypothetical protein HR45_00655 [Shewanella mangrovi]
MSIGDKFKALYMSDVAIQNGKSLTNMCIYFDEIHIFPPFYELYVSNVIDSNMEKISQEDLSDNFVPQLKDSLDNILPPKIERMNSFTAKNNLLFEEIIKMDSPQILDIGKKYIDSFFRHDKSKYTDTFSEVFEKSGLGQIDAFHYAMQKSAIDEHKMLPVSDIELSGYLQIDKRNFTEQLSWMIADECMNLALPCANSIHPEEILEIREKLSQELLPFRMAMQSLVSNLMNEIINLKELNIVGIGTSEIEDFHYAAKYLVKTKVEPELTSLSRKISLENGKLWRKVFGRTISWVPLVAKAFISPSPEIIYGALDKGGKDIEDLLLKAQTASAVRQQGLNFLLNMQSITSSSK